MNAAAIPLRKRRRSHLAGAFPLSSGPRKDCTMAHQTVLDSLFAEVALPAVPHPIAAGEKRLVHVVGAQEPVRDQPDDRARSLLGAGWLAVELIDPGRPEAERAGAVSAVQQAARAWLKQTGEGGAEDKEQVRWLFEKTRSHESKQLIAQRVWRRS